MTRYAAFITDEIPRNVGIPFGCYEIDRLPSQVGVVELFTIPVRSANHCSSRRMFNSSQEVMQGLSWSREFVLG